MNLFVIIITIIVTNHLIINTYQQQSQSQPPPVDAAVSLYNYLIDMTHNIYSSQVIIKAKALNKIKQQQQFSVLLQIEAVYRNNENRSLNLIPASSQQQQRQTVYYTKIFLQNISLPITVNTVRQFPSQQHVYSPHRHHNQQQQATSSSNINDILINKTYILFLNKPQSQSQQHDFYTLYNLKSNSYVRERVPKLTLFSNPIEWSQFSENFISNSLCKSCSKSALVEKDPQMDTKTYFTQETLLIDCKFNGNPLPFIKWTKSNQTLAADDKRISIKTARFNSVLKIENLTLNDRGDYYCIAYNNINNTQKISYKKVKVLVFKKNAPSPSQASTATRGKFIEIMPTTTKATTLVSKLIDAAQATTTEAASAIYKRKDGLMDFDFEPCQYNLNSRYAIKCLHGGQCFKSRSYSYGHPYFRQFCVCKRGFEGKNCEIESIGSWFSDNELNDFPADIKQLYDRLNAGGGTKSAKSRSQQG